MSQSEKPTSATPSSAEAASDAFWAAAELGTSLMELDHQECLELLAAKSVGRLAYVVDNGARILPFKYVLAEDSVIFRTETDEFFQSGWSVVVVGRLELASEEDFARMFYGKLPEPWAGGSRYMFVRLRCEHVSGRRVIGHGR